MELKNMLDVSKTSNKPTKDSTKNNTKRPKIDLQIEQGLIIKKLVLLHTRSITHGVTNRVLPNTL